MLRKRLIGVVTIRNDWVVQSFGFRHYLPIGKPECIVENLDRWGADEILIQIIDRSINNLGPDIELLSKIANCGISTPVTYAGGITSEIDAVNIIRAGADRICIDSLLFSNPEEVRNIAHRLGSQAIIATFPITIGDDGNPIWYNYQTKQFALNDKRVQSLIKDGVISEAILVDYLNEGCPDSFDFRLLSMFSDTKIPIILFGGLSNPVQLEKGLLDPRVSAVAVGNFLNYREHAVQKLKHKLAVSPIRPPFYSDYFLEFGHE